MSKPNSPLASTMLITMALSGWGLARVTSRAGGARGPISNKEPSPRQQSQESALARQLVRVWVHASDLYPSVVRVRPGKILIVAENETQGDVSLAVERVLAGGARASLTSLRTSERGKRVNREVTIDVGEYVFYSESNPALQGRLIAEVPIDSGSPARQ